MGSMVRVTSIGNSDVAEGWSFGLFSILFTFTGDLCFMALGIEPT